MSARKVLIIDDEKDLCHLMKSFLLQQHFEVLTSYSLEEGLQMARAETPDILIMDNNLPDGLGWDKIGIVQSFLPHCKIILISAYKVIAELTIENVAVLEKPISFLKLQNHL
jgi:two-component system OmpR family response regulator